MTESRRKKVEWIGKGMAVTGAILKSLLEAFFQLVWGLAGVLLIGVLLLYLRLNDFLEEIPLLIPVKIGQFAGIIADYFSLFMIVLFFFYLYINLKEVLKGEKN